MVPWLSRGGGLALLWKNDMNVTIFNSSDRYIDVVVDYGINHVWRFMGFYEDSSTSRENS